MPLIDWLSKIGGLFRRNNQPARSAKCARDAMTIPSIGSVAVSADVSLELFWCWSCGMGDAYCKERQRGFPAFEFHWDQQGMSWRLRRFEGTLDEGTAVRVLNQWAPNGPMPHWEKSCR
jgi:hypothetical protein